MSGYQENVYLAVLIVVLSTKTKFLHLFFVIFEGKWRPSWIFLKNSNIEKATFKNSAT